MKKLSLVALLVLIVYSCAGQIIKKKQTTIPLNNTSGVPFYKAPDLGDFIIEGFEVDKDGRLYFMGGGKQFSGDKKTHCLALFQGNKQVFRKY